MEYQEIKEKALEVKELYRQKNKEDGHKEWYAGDYLTGFMGDIGDLAKLVMAKEGYRSKENVDEKIRHELADCLWSLIVIADELDVDLDDSFIKTMEELRGRF